MPMPATTGQLRSSIGDMEIGDYIVCSAVRSSTTAINLKDLGKSVLPEIDLGGLSSISSGRFYFIKVDKGLLIADRVVFNTITWDTLNSAKYIEGTIWEGEGKIRAISGGVSYADANGNKSATEQGYGGWPPINEWDKYILGFPQTKILEGKNIDDVFHVDNYSSFCKETPITTTSANYRVQRRRDMYPFWSNPSTYSNVAIGFRPIFEYREV